MFGFLRVPKRGLDASETELYRSHFCAVCHALDSETGKLSSLLTNYDMTFWVLLAAALETGERGPVEQRRCTAIPWRKVPVQDLGAPTRTALTAITHHLIGSKLEDDALDGERRLLGWAMKAIRRPTAAARQSLHALGLSTAALENLFPSQTEAEQADSPDLESLSQPTRKMMAEIFGYIPTLTGQTDHRASLDRIGWHLGGFLYLLDPVSDYSNDVKRKRFNALERVFGATWSRPAVRARLNGELSSLEAALITLPIDDARGALCENLLGELQQRVRQALPTAAAPAKRGLWARVKPARRPSNKLAQLAAD